MKWSLNKPKQLVQLFKIMKLVFFSNSDKQSLLLDILERPYYDQDTFEDPVHSNFRFFIQEANKLEKYSILDLGARDVNKKALFTGYKEYVGFDIHSGKNVDVVGDIHQVSTYFPEKHFDVVLSIATFEHLAMPWKAILEINTVMKPGGLLFIGTHPTWPAHALPWDFWRFSKAAFEVLLNSSTGYELIRCAEGLPCSILPFGNEESMIGLHKQPANLAVSVVAKKTSYYDERLTWDVKTDEILNSIYPKHL
jgi:SAM-dependent methyltransferase